MANFPQFIACPKCGAQAQQVGAVPPPGMGGDIYYRCSQQHQLVYDLGTGKLR